MISAYHLIFLVLNSFLLWNYIHQPISNQCNNRAQEIFKSLRQQRCSTILHHLRQQDRKLIIENVKNASKRRHLKQCRKYFQNFTYILPKCNQNSVNRTLIKNNFENALGKNINLQYLSKKQSNLTDRIFKLISLQLQSYYKNMIDFKLKYLFIGPTFKHTKNKMKLYKDLFIRKSRDTNVLKLLYEISLEFNKTMKKERVLPINDILAILPYRNSSREAIYFTETSGTGKVVTKFVCAVESAARVYPHADVYLLVPYLPPSGFREAENIPLYNVLNRYENIQILKVDIDKFIKGTKIEKFFGQVRGSRYLGQHTSDVLRILTVYLYGGRYFDLDIVLTRNLSRYSNFVVEEYDTGSSLANGAFGFEKEHEILDYMLEKMPSNYGTHIWDAIGPKLMSKAVAKYTGITNFQNMTVIKNVTKLKFESLFPVYYKRLYNDEKDNHKEVLEKIENTPHAFGVHTFNYQAHLQKLFDTVKVGTNQGYSLLGEKFCPVSYWSCDEFFK